MHVTPRTTRKTMTSQFTFKISYLLDEKKQEKKTEAVGWSETAVKTRFRIQDNNYKKKHSMSVFLPGYCAVVITLDQITSTFSFLSSAAHRRRKSSMEQQTNSTVDSQRSGGGGNGFDSPSTPKRPRVFFTEDQKDSLRRAYAQDPYPNQSTIEALARSLGVGVKTVINWFHNHRMRAKQQHHSGWESNGNSRSAGGGGEAGGMSVKSEPDESSNQSDMSSVSGDTGGSQTAAAGVALPAVTSSLPSALTANSNSSSGGGGGGGVTPADLNQWMFPKFEPMNPLRKVHNNFMSAIGSGGMVAVGNDEDNKENNGGLPDDDTDEPDCLDATTSNINNNNNNEKEKDEANGEEEEGQDADNDDDDDNEDEENRPRKRQRISGDENDGSGVSFSSTASVSAKPVVVAASAGLMSAGATTSGVNKRKRSQPQRVYEGAQLDKLGSFSGTAVSHALPGEASAGFGNDEEGKAMLSGYTNDGESGDEEEDVDGGGVDDNEDDDGVVVGEDDDGAGEDDGPAMPCFNTSNTLKRINPSGCGQSDGGNTMISGKGASDHVVSDQGDRYRTGGENNRLSKAAHMDLGTSASSVDTDGEREAFVD